MKTNGQRRRKARAGYSLVEVTLALLVVAVGLTATFALFPEGLQAARAAVNDTEIGLFADYVFTTLDLTSGKYGGNFGVAPPKGWRINNTDDFISMMLSADAPDSKFQLRTGGSAQQFYWIPDYYGLSSGDYASGNFRDFWTSAFTYTLTVALTQSGGYPAYATLKVWPGEVQGRDEDAKVFYREILPIR